MFSSYGKLIVEALMKCVKCIAKEVCLQLSVAQNCVIMD